MLFKIQLVEANCSKNSTRNVSKIPGFRSWNFSHNVSRILEKIVDQLLLHPEFCSNCWIGEFTGWCFLFFLQECEKKNRWPLNEDFHSQWDHYLCIESFSFSFVNLSLVKLIVFWGDFFFSFLVAQLNDHSIRVFGIKKCFGDKEWGLMTKRLYSIK